MCLLGAFQAGPQWSTMGFNFESVAGTRGELGPCFAVVAGIGMIVTAIYLLYMVGRIVWGTLSEPGAHGHGHADGKHSAAASHDPHAHSTLPKDLTRREILVVAPLAALCLLLGVFPTPILR